MNNLEDSELFLGSINNYLLDFTNKVNQENNEFLLKKKKILNQSNILFTEIVINYCSDLKDKLEKLAYEYKNNSQIDKTKNIIQTFCEIFIVQLDKDNREKILKDLKDFYTILSELNSLLLSKFKFTLVNIISSIKDKYSKDDSIIFIDQQGQSTPGTIVSIPEEVNGPYIIRTIINNQTIKISKDELLPDIIQFFILDKDEPDTQYSMIRYFCRILNGNEEGYEIKLYLLSVLMPSNLFHTPFSSKDYNYTTLDKKVVVWRDSHEFEQLTSNNINKIGGSDNLKKIYDYLYLNKSFLEPSSELKIIYENSVDSFDFKLLFNLNTLRDNITRYIKVRDLKSSDIYWIQIQDIKFQVIENTFFYSYDKRLKRNLLNKKDSITLQTQIPQKNENIILPDYNNNKVLFLTPVTLVSEHYIPSGTKVIDKSSNQVCTVVETKEGSTPGEKIYNIKRDGERIRSLISSNWKKREELLWKDYQNIDGYISIEDTNCNLLQDDNLNGSLFKYLDSSILENLFSLQKPIVNLSIEENDYLERIEQKLGNKMHTLQSLYSHSSNHDLKWFSYLKAIISENVSLEKGLNLGLLSGFYYKPLYTMGLMGSKKIVESVFNIFNELLFNQIDISYFHNLYIKKFFGQDLEKLIFQCLKYDYQYDKTPILLESILENPINDNFSINKKGYEILSVFLDFSRLHKDNQIRTYLLFQNLLKKINSSEQVSHFLVDLLNVKNIDNESLEISKEYISSISNTHYISVEKFKFDNDYSMNNTLKNYLFELSTSKVNKLKSLTNFLNLDVDGQDIDLEKFYVIDNCTGYDNNNNSYLIKKNEIVFKKKDSFPFLYTDKKDKYQPKKLFVSVFIKDINLNIPRNNIEYSFGD